MIRARTAASIASLLAWKGSLSMIGVAICLGMVSRKEAAPTAAHERECARQGRIVVSDDGRKVRASLGVAGAEKTTRFVLCDGRGREILELTLFEDDHFGFRLGMEKAVRASGYSARDGSLGLVLDAGGNGYQFDARPDGSADLGAPGGPIVWSSDSFGLESEVADSATPGFPDRDRPR